MDGKGRFLDNILVERLWRSLKYEYVYRHAWQGGSHAKAGVASGPNSITGDTVTRPMADDLPP